MNTLENTRRRYAWAAVALLVLILLFVTGYYTYIHVGGPLFAQTHSSATMRPAGMCSVAGLYG